MIKEPYKMIKKPCKIIEELKYSFVIFVLFGIALPLQPALANCDSCASLKGTVTDIETGEPLIGANVVLDSSDYGAAADIDGNYIIKFIKPGVYNVRASYIGYSIISIDDVIINPNDIQVVDFKLEQGYFSASMANEDIKAGDIKILLYGLVILCSSLEEINKLAAEYGFKYELTGCVIMGGENRYNDVMFEYLNNKNKEGWQEEFQKREKILCENRRRK